MNRNFACVKSNIHRQVGSREAESVRAHLGVPQLRGRPPRPRLGPRLRRPLGRRSPRQDRPPHRRLARRQPGTGTLTYFMHGYSDMHQ